MHTLDHPVTLVVLYLQVVVADKQNIGELGYSLTVIVESHRSHYVYQMGLT